ncbi:MAG: hypothetical protein WCI54_04685 [Bacteroidia bacterium]|jgi:hypothetical protein
METIQKKTIFAKAPSWLLAFLTMILSTILLFAIGEGTKQGELAYVVYDLVIVVGCYFIVKQNPGSIWYVLIISNLMGILPAIIEQNFWITTMWMFVCTGWVLSILAAIAGMLIGKKKAVSDNP